MAAGVDGRANPLDLINAVDRTRGQIGQRRIDADALLPRHVACGFGQIAIRPHAAPIDNRVENLHPAFEIAQVLELGMPPDGTGDAHVLTTIDDQPLQLLRVIDPVQRFSILALPRFSRARHLPHELRAVAVLAVFELQRLREPVEFSGISVGERQRHRTVLRLDRDRRKAVSRHEHATENGVIELRVVRDRAPAIRVAGRFEERRGQGLSGQPDFNIAVVDRVADAQYVGRRIASITPRAARSQANGGAGFGIPEQLMHGQSPRATGIRWNAVR